MNKKGFATLAILLIVLAIVIVGVGYFYFERASCSLYTWFGESDPAKSFIFNGVNAKSQKLRVEFDTSFLGEDNTNFYSALEPYADHASGTILISDPQFIGIAQANGEPEDAVFVQILNSVAASFKLN